MKYEVYDNLRIGHNFEISEFKSIGKNGPFLKRIKFVDMGIDNVVNLLFGDVDQDNEINDRSITNNDDRDKILATVAKVIEIYTYAYPDRWVYFCGSTKERTRLYRMAIGLNLNELIERFEIFVETEDQEGIIEFEKNVKASSFLIKRKIN